MGALRYNPNNPNNQPQTQTPSDSASGGGGSLRFDPNNPNNPPATADGQGQGGSLRYNPNQGSVAGTGTWGDFGTVASNESLMYGLPGLRAQAEAARQRLGPNWSAAADVAGSIGSPTSLLNMVPYVGPELAGGAHEGIKSAITNWNDPSWMDYLAKVGKDTAGGVATAGVGHGGAEYATKLLPKAIEWGVPSLSGGAVKHYLSSVLGDSGYDLAAALGVTAALAKPSQWAGRAAETLGDQPAVQNAIKLLSQGAGSALRNSSPGPLWDQWVPSQ